MAACSWPSSNQRDWVRLCELLRELGLAEDSRFADSALRTQHGAALKELLGKALRRFDAQELLDMAERVGFMMALVKGYAEVLEDPQAVGNESFQTIDTFDGAQLAQVRGPFQFLGERPTLTGGRPSWGRTLRACSPISGMRWPTSTISSSTVSFAGGDRVTARPPVPHRGSGAGHPAGAASRCFRE